MLIVITVTKLIFKLLIFFPLHLGRHIALLKSQPVDVRILPQDYCVSILSILTG